MQITLKENNLWNDSMVKVVNSTSVVFADSTNNSSSVTTAAMEPVITTQDIKEISSSNKPTQSGTITSNYIGDCDIEIKGWDMINSKLTQ